MHKKIIFAALVFVGIGLIASYLIFSGHSNRATPGNHTMSDGSVMNDSDSAMDHHDHSAMQVRSEKEFIEQMIPHHQEAVDTAKEVIARGGSTKEIKGLATAIIAAQEKEIAAMKVWYQTWYKETYKEDTNNYQPMMRDLSSVNGAALDKIFLTDMVPHHMGAIAMAQSVIPHIENPEITDLTKAIIESQAAEIELMKELLLTL